MVTTPILSARGLYDVVAPSAAQCLLCFPELVSSTCVALLADAGSLQVGPDTEASAEGEAGHDAALRPQTAENPDQVPGAPVEEEQHENHVGHLPEGAAPHE